MRLEKILSHCKSRALSLLCSKAPISKLGTTQGRRIQESESASENVHIEPNRM